MPLRPSLLPLHPEQREQREQVLGVMAELAASGRGWVNLTPDVDPEELPPPPGPFQVFSPFGPPVPLCTWTPPDLKKPSPRSLVGVQHGRGTRLAENLAELDAPLREGWRVVQDQPKKGLVVAVPSSEGLEEILRWLLHAGAALCPFPYSRWVVAVYR